jgi:glycosyltransferase involved in cell wall biosynthesis
MKIIVGVTLYNSADIIERTLSSIMSQTHTNFVCYITDDLSTDNSVDVVREFIKDDDRFKLIVNTKKRYQGGNYDLICRELDGVDDEDIFIEVDGDDWLANSRVFERVLSVYESGDIWITNGSFKYSDGRIGFSSKITDFNDLRRGSFVASHLRTWKIWLWRKINVQDLKYDGDYWPTTGDLSFMYPMLEMARSEHYQHIPEYHYVYNGNNPLSDHRINMSKVNFFDNYARLMPPYHALK